MAAPNPVGPHGGDIEGLYLAGDWCATGWPATMEGAVRSGYAAAAAIAAQPRTQ
jgi:monoamine oxidase